MRNRSNAEELGDLLWFSWICFHKACIKIFTSNDYPCRLCSLLIFSIPTSYYNGDLETPFLYKGRLELSFNEKMIILMLNIDQSKVCTRRPLKFQGNAVFDRESLKGKGDWLCTDLGSFVNKGQSGRIMTVKGRTITNRSAATRNGPICGNDNLLEACQVHRFLQNDHSCP